MDQAEPDVLSYMTVPEEHCIKLYSTSPTARLNGEIERHTEVAGVFQIATPCSLSRTMSGPFSGPLKKHGTRGLQLHCRNGHDPSLSASCF
jgi:hypothetical protein